ncbi:MAG: MFS transporter [Zoogloea sp.]|nr:MFS transporter [Zoogloea sp.]
MAMESDAPRSVAPAWQEAAGVVASCVLGIAANLTYMALPVMLGVAADAAHLDESQVGWLGSVEVSGMLVGALTFLLLVRSHRLRALGLVALIAVAVGALALLLASGFTGFAVARAVGGFGAGLGNSLAVVCMGYTLSAARNQGRLNASIIFCGALCLATFGWSGERWGLAGVVWPIMLLAVIGVIGIPFLPVPAEKATIETTDAPAPISPSPASTSAALLGTWLLAATLSQLAPAAGWAYAERVGVEVGLSTGHVGVLLTAATLLSAACCLGAHRASARWGSLPCTALCVGCLLIGFASWAIPNAGAVGYGARLAAITTFWALLTVFQITGMAELARSAKWMSSVPLAQNLGAAIGPGIGAVLSGGNRTLQDSLSGCSLLLALPLLIVTAIAIGRRNSLLSKPLTEDSHEHP